MSHKSLVILLLIIFSCKENSTSNDLSDEISASYKQELNEYRSGLDGVRKNGYLQLIALLKMDKDTMVFGKQSSNSLFLNIEEIPDSIGVFIKKDSLYMFETNKSLAVLTMEDSLISSSLLSLDEFGSSVKMKHDRLNWQVITRNNTPYLRVWDTKNPEIEAFKGFESYPITTEMLIKGNFKYYETSKSEKVDSQLGPKANTEFIGQVTFEYQGKEYSLDVGNNGFTMVADETTGEETYGGGRYIYLNLPDSDGIVEIDFNKLYNPPCSFNKYTTCLYPPQQNYLDFKINAGEKIALTQ